MSFSKGSKKVMGVLLIGASSLLLAITALLSTAIALFVARQVGRMRKVDCVYEQTRLMKAVGRKRVPRELREFSMLETDTITYLQSVRAFSKQDELHRIDSIFPRGQFKREFRPKRQFKAISRATISTKNS
jgi:hypothetical protein